ncbi:MAG: NTP transferase domain-containing protein [Lachnospiraceae bacterium]|nr:NTP transferase domain-containing protein [Lachnospiraceae bacterium]
MQNKTHKLSIGILAGGKSSRMGENKALLKIGKDRVIDKLTKELGGFSELIISAAKKGEYESLGFKWYMMKPRKSDRLKASGRFFQ